MTIAAGNSQTEQVGQALATPFGVAITDQYGNDLSGLNVTFTAPASGPSGAFAGSQTNSETDATNGSGVATASTFTAGPHAGSYKVQASVAGLNPVDFSVTNQVGPPRSLQIFSNNQSAKIDQPFALPLSALVLDQFGNPIAGQSVTFTAPTAGASGTFPTGATSETVTTGSTGYATSDTFTANATTGSYHVKASDGALASNFSLTNTPGPLTQPTGYLVVNSGPISTLSPSNTTGSVTCPATSTGVARYPQDGGVSFQSHSLYASVNSSYATGTSWSVAVKNRTGAATTFTVWAVCAVPNPGYVQLNSTSVPNARGAQTEASDACPTGTKIIGGGVQNSSPYVTIYDSYPSGNSWVVHVDNPGIDRQHHVRLGRLLDIHRWDRLFSKPRTGRTRRVEQRHRSGCQLPLRASGSRRRDQRRLAEHQRQPELKRPHGDRVRVDEPREQRNTLLRRSHALGHMRRVSRRLLPMP